MSLTAAFIVFQAGRVGAEEAPAPPSLAEILEDQGRLVAWLQAHQADVRAARARTAQAQADRSASRLWPNPALVVNFGDVPVGLTNPPGLNLGQTAIYSGGISQAVEIGKRGPRGASAQLRLDAARASSQDTLAQVLSDARNALARLVYVKSRKLALEESLTAARQALDLQRLRLEKGDLSGNDYDRLYLDTLSLENDDNEAAADYEGSLAECRSFLAGPCRSDGVELTDLERLAPLPSLPVDLDHALLARPDIVALAASEGAAREDRILANRRKIPDPTLGLAYTEDRLTISGDQPRTLAMNLSFPLPLFDRGQHDAARAEARAQELAESRQMTLARARSEVDGLLGRREFVRAALGRARDEALPRSKRVLASTIAAFNEGEMSMTDVLLARRSDTELTLKLMQLQFESFSVDNRLRVLLGLESLGEHP